ncbi:PPOX class F420-dependent oxidoreductase [Amycolatopsis acidicola]|uniref:PPOX class F420-dependent oxidoreductase n=1 Tax=Amycolatopsis acidicola TaxID=2596893 RepID=A0A5N0VA73_9PSEU|nr:PPOX class F420-dependent oxidoreductase [Amycolatopsis acidicola]KAA9163287.1 PPOX class F420-dependent oxidoreductase [Amycolatopsis acidicola]
MPHFPGYADARSAFHNGHSEARHAGRTATAERVDRAALLDFIRPRHRALLVTTRADGGVQISPVTCGLDRQGWIVVASYPDRAKTRNSRRDPQVSICVLSDDWTGPHVQVDGLADVVDTPAALDDLEDFFSRLPGERPGRDGQRSLIRIEIECWGPVAEGGFPPGLPRS